MLLPLKALGRTFQTLVDLFKKDFWYVAVLHCLVVKVWWYYDQSIMTRVLRPDYYDQSIMTRVL